MSRNRYTPEQIISMLREAEVALAQGQSVGQACRTLGCQRRSKISPPGRSKTSPLNVMRYAVLGGCPGSP